MEKTVDARGIPCPQPVIRTKEALKDMNEGTLVVLVDNEIAVQNVIRFGTYKNTSPTWEKTGEKEYRVTLQIGTESHEKHQTSEEKSEPDPSQMCHLNDAGCKKTVVVLSSDKMGEGSEELGRILMKGFVYALTQLDRLPDTILLYNGGARLSSEGSASAEDLKLLESQGVEIMTCGTCLDYYGLTGKLQAGTVTNMYEIAERLTGADTIVRP